MPVGLDRVRAPARRPERPRMLLWLGVLGLFLAVGMGATVLFATQALREQPLVFWRVALGVPLLGWAILGFGRVVLYAGQHSAADGWDEAREIDLIRKIRRGRRSLQVLGVSLSPALHDPQQPALGKAPGLTAQADTPDESPVRHTRLPAGADEAPEEVLLRALTQVLTDLGQPLAQLPQEQPLALLLEVDSGLSEGLLRRVWQQAWRACGIRQSVLAVEGCGLAAVDQWLDWRIGDQALLLVVAVQFAVQPREGSAEAVVGVLLGNRLTQTTLPAIASLHRPEQERTLADAELLQAARRSLDWVPLDGAEIEQVWRVGVDAQRTAALTGVMLEAPIPAGSPQGVSDLDALLGHSGKASPWLAISTAAQTIERGAGAQFIFSGSNDAAGLWCTVLTPASPPAKQEI